jgi:hypothetical protein
VIEADDMSKEEKDEKDEKEDDVNTSQDKPKKESDTNPMEMGMGMAKKMMGQMGQGGPSPMEMMQKMMKQMGKGDEGSAQMPPMMQMCMGMCAEMLTTMKQTTDMAAFATPELRLLFTDWLAALEDEAIRQLQKSGDMDDSEFAQALNISNESAAYLITQLIQKNKVRAHIYLAEEHKND